MYDTVAAMGFRFKELEEDCAVDIGCLSVLKRLRRRGHLSHQEYLCAVAALRGQLEELKALRENGCPWDEGTCSGAVFGGHLDILQWVRANGCPWDNRTCTSAAEGGHFEVRQWARENGCPE